MRTVWGGRQGAAALAVIVVMVVGRGVLVAGSYFNQDDYFFVHRALDAKLDFDYLVLTPNAGHVNPLQQLTFWIAARTAPFEWGVYAGFLILAQLLTTLVLWHVLTRLLPGRWARLPLLAMFAWSPLTLMTSLWWAAAICLWPHLLCSFVGVLCLLRERQGAGRSWVNQSVVLGAFVTGLLWHERAVLIAPVLVAAAVMLEDDVVGWRRIPSALRRFRWMWLGVVLVLGGFLVAHQAITSVEGGRTDVGVSLQISWAFVGQNVVPGLVSGPWSATVTGGAVEPHLWVTITSIVILLGAVALLLRFGGPARRWALLFLVVYVLGDLALVLAGRSGFGRVVGLDPRYASDTLHAAVLAAAFALRGAPRQEALHWPRRLVAGVAAGGVALYLTGSAFGAAVLVPHFQNPEDRAYIGHLRADLAADPNQVIVDALVPPDIVLPLVGDDSLLSRVLEPLPEDPVFDQPSSRMRMVDGAGRLVRVVLAGSIPMEPGPVAGCGYSVKTTEVTVPLAVEIRGRLVAHLGYFTDREATVAIATDTWSSTFLARPGPNDLWFVLPDEGEPVTSVRFRVEDDPIDQRTDPAPTAPTGSGTVCVASLEVGLPETP